MDNQLYGFKNFAVCDAENFLWRALGRLNVHRNIQTYDRPKKFELGDKMRPICEGKKQNCGYTEIRSGIYLYHLQTIKDLKDSVKEF